MVDDKEEGHVPFSVVELAGGTLIGTATLWGIDNHHQSAHVGLGLLPASSGEGYSTDVVAVLCHYVSSCAVCIDCRSRRCPTTPRYCAPPNVTASSAKACCARRPG